MRKKLKTLLEVLVIEIQKAQKRADETKKAANEIARSAAASPSQSGDREHSAGQALITKEVLLRLQEAKDDIEKNINLPADTATPPCFVKIELQGVEKEFYFVNHPLHVAGFSFVSKDSELGKTLSDKKEGETFEVGDIKGKVISIE
jgi:hypothetical protein